MFTGGAVTIARSVIVFYQIRNKVNKTLTRRFLGFSDALQKCICKENLVFAYCAKQCLRPKCKQKP